VVEVVTWHNFLGHTSPRCSLIFIAWIFQLKLSSFDLIREGPHDAGASQASQLEPTRKQKTAGKAPTQILKLS
jgi:hypothetical protein